MADNSSKYYFIKHRRSFKDYLKRYILVLPVILFSVLLIISLSLLSSNLTIYNGKIQKLAPLPTALDPNFLTQVNDCFIATATVYGYSLRIASGFRSIANQAILYQQGRTVDGHIVTLAEGGKSLHNYGFAVDVADIWRGYKINWVRLGKIGNYCGLEQGGADDLSHFEHRDGLLTADFAAGLRPPPLILPCTVMSDRVAENKPLTFKDLQNCGAPDFSKV